MNEDAMAKIKRVAKLERQLEHVYNSMIRDNAALRSELEKANTVRRDEVLIKTGLKKRLSNLLKRQV
jgi:hypothetical protein